MTPPPDTTARHPIRVVARLTGLEPPVIRAWERRYGAVAPARTGGRHRQYSDAEIDRLTLLRRATEAGHSIGQVARYSDEALLDLLADYEASRATSELPGGDVVIERDTPDVAACLEAARDLDDQRLLFQLERALVDLGPARALAEVVAPLARRLVGGLDEHELRPMHRALAGAVIRSFCDHLIRRHHPPAGAATLLVAAPAGQRRDIGAYLLAAVAALRGWRAIYLGADLPAEEIVAAARQTAASAVALSVSRIDRSWKADEIVRIRRHLEATVPILAEGPVAPAYAAELEAARVLRITDPARLPGWLSRLESEGSGAGF